MHRTFNLLVCRHLIALSCMLMGSVVSSEEYAALPPKGIEVPQAKLDELTKRIEKLQSQLNQSRGLKDGQRGRSRCLFELRRWRWNKACFTSLKISILRCEPSRSVPRDCKLRNKVQANSSCSLSAARKPRILDCSRADFGHRSMNPFSHLESYCQRNLCPQENKTLRLDVWLHGRGDTATEIPFLLERLDKVGQYSHHRCCGAPSFWATLQCVQVRR